MEPEIGRAYVLNTGHVGLLLRESDGYLEFQMSGRNRRIKKYTKDAIVRPAFPADLPRGRDRDAMFPEREPAVVSPEERQIRWTALRDGWSTYTGGDSCITLGDLAQELFQAQAAQDRMDILAAQLANLPVGEPDADEGSDSPQQPF